MGSEPLQLALTQLTGAVNANPELVAGLLEFWRQRDRGIAESLRAAAMEVEQAPSDWPQTFARVLTEENATAAMLWCAACCDRPDVRMAKLVHAFSVLPVTQGRALELAQARLVQGPLEDALACAPLLDPETLFEDPGHAQARARMEILIWEAGACARQMPTLGAWIWSSPEAFASLVATPARGTLRGRVYAARCLEIAVPGIPPMTDPQLVGRTLQVLQPLLLHPEPMVWIHAARCFGRLSGTFEPLEGTLLDWVHGESRVLRQRALTAFASLPGMRLQVLGHELDSILAANEEDAGVLSAVAAATPYLFHERRALWDSLADRILQGAGGAVAARALARGLGTLWRRGSDRGPIVEPIQRLRHLARRGRREDVEGYRRWIETLAVTDPVEDAERDPLDVERGLENLVRLAAQYDDEEADARSARFASTLSPSFREAQRILLGDGSHRHRASAMNAYEGCARSLALRLWEPMLATHPSQTAIKEPPLDETWAMVASAPEELLDAVRERREGNNSDPAFELGLEVLALKLGGYALDATGSEQNALGPGRGQTAHAICRWLRKLDGLVDGTREMPESLQAALSALFWRLVDATRGTALGEVDDMEWLGPFAAWWALVVDRPQVLQQLATALPMIAAGALESCCDIADQTRALLSAGMENGEWGPGVVGTLEVLNAGNTELARALSSFADALEGFENAAGPRPDLDACCLALALSAEQVRRALNDPVRALRDVQGDENDDSLLMGPNGNAPRVALTIARAVRTRQPALLDVWFASLGQTIAKLVEAAVVAAVKRTPPPPPKPKTAEPKTVVGYELVKALGEGGVGTVWLVRKPGADRLFVLKIPKADALESASDTEREGILASFKDEAKALADLYHPNVANIIDRGVADGMPYLVLEYLIGADLKQYSTAAPMTLFELNKVVTETCAGLTALHNAGLVHRDIKPANIWLRLPLGRGQGFEPEKHRNPAVSPPLASVIIDFGMVRAMRVPPEVGGRFVAGTPGYIAPEQVLDPVELDGRADVYGLAGLIYNVTTGRVFFDEIEDQRERIIAHMQRDPMENLDPFRDFPNGMVKLFRAATAMDYKDRPTPLEFGRAFSALL